MAFCHSLLRPAFLHVSQPVILRDGHSSTPDRLNELEDGISSLCSGQMREPQLRQCSKIKICCDIKIWKRRALLITITLVYNVENTVEEKVLLGCMVFE